MLAQGVMLTLMGLALGLTLSFGITRFLSSLLLGVSGSDVLTFSAVSLLLGAVVLVACLVPALRAMDVDPIVALRYE